MRVILFNLIPYREVQEVRRQRRFWLTTGVAIGLAALFCHQLTTELDDRIAQKKKFLSNIEEVALQVSDRAKQAEALKKERELLKSRVQLLEAVDQRSLAQCKLFERFDSSRPDRSRISSLELKGNGLSVGGNTADVPILSAWVESLEQDKELFKRLDIVSVEKWRPAQLDKNVKGGHQDWPGVSVDFHQFALRAELNPKLRPTLSIKGGDDAGY